MKAITTKKNSTAKKLVPAAGSLLISAAMLGTSTFAWFTMSREVEVKNIKMTATVPEDIQISLGMLSTTAGSKVGLATNNGVLVNTSGNASDGNVSDPGDTTDEWWANTADISNYYQLGRIIPASSTTGLNIYYTPDAAGVGKTLKTGALYYTAATGATPTSETGGTNMRTTLHAYTKEGGVGDNWYTAGGDGNYTTAESHDKTNDDGYYVDIPVWLRSASTKEVNLSVDAYVTSTSTEDDDDLYMAARAVILNDARNTVNTGGLIEVRKDGWEGTSIVDYMDTTVSDFEAVQSVDGNNKATYADATRYAGTQNVVTVPAATGQGYGDAVKVWIRVWLEGEDPNCWNDNAGQDFNISLKFVNGVTSSASTISFDSKRDNTKLLNGTTTTVKFVPSAGGTAFNNMTFAYNGATSKWEYYSGTFKKPVNVKFSLGTDTDITSIDEILAQLNTAGFMDTREKATIGAEVIATGQTVTFTGTKAQAAVWADAIPTGATTLKCGENTASDVDDLKSKIASAATDNVTVSYVAPVPTGT